MQDGEIMLTDYLDICGLHRNLAKLSHLSRRAVNQSIPKCQHFVVLFKLLTGITDGGS